METTSSLRLPEAPRLNLRDRSLVEVKAELSLFARLTLSIPLCAILGSLLYSYSIPYFGFIPLYLRVLALFFFLTSLCTIALLWYFNAFAPHKSLPDRMQRFVRKETIEVPNESLEEEPLPSQGSESPSVTPCLNEAPTLSGSRSVPAALDVLQEPINDEQHLKDMEQVAAFWQPASSASSSSSSSSSSSVSMSPEAIAASEANSAVASTHLPEALHLLASTKFIASLSKADFAEMYQKVDWITLPAHHRLYERGDDLDSGMYIVSSGQIDMYEEDDEFVCSHTSGELIGEEVIFEGEKRWLSSRVSAHGVKLIRMSRALVNEWRMQKPEVIISFVRTSISRQWRQAVFVLHHFFGLPLNPDAPAEVSRKAAVKQLPFFVPALAALFLKHSSFLESLAACHSRSLAAGELLFEEASHQHQNSLFLVLSGRLQATRKDSAGVEQSLERGDVLDPFSFLCDTPHNMTVTASEDTTLVFLTPVHFQNELAHPCLLTLVEILLAEMKPILRTFTRYGMKREWFKAGQILFRQNRAANEMFVISSGRVRVINERQLASADSQQPATAAGTRTTRQSPLTASPIKVRDTPGFSEDPEYAQESAAEAAAGAEGAAGKGEEPTAEFGDAEALGGGLSYGKYDPMKQHHAAVRLELARGDCVGESSLLQQFDEPAASSFCSSPPLIAKHSSTAICRRDSEVIRINRACLRRLINAFPSALLRLTSIISRRLSTHMSSQQGERSAGGEERVKCVCVAIVPLPHADCHAFASSLLEALSTYGAALLITPQLVDSILGAGTSRNLSSYYHRSRLTIWLAELEETHAFLVFLASHSLSAWSSLAVRSSDNVFVLADAKRSPIAADAIEKALVWDSIEKSMASPSSSSSAASNSSPTASAASSPSSSSSSPRDSRSASPRSSSPSSASTSSSPSSATSSRMSSPSSADASKSAETRKPTRHFLFSVNDLVLLHPPSTELPSGTRHWLRSRPHLHSYHHVRSDLRSHFDRLARYLSNHSIGVCLGGGGARGLAHAGFFRALLELELNCDFIGGTSQGSFVAALLAQMPMQHISRIGFIEEKTHAMARDMANLMVLFSDATLPVISYFSGHVFSESIGAILGKEVQIEDLWIKYCCVSVNLSQADIVVHTSGSLYKAARASMTVVEMLPPQQLSPQQRDLLVDGGYCCNLPCDVLKELFNPSCIIACDVERKGDASLKNMSFYGDSLSGWYIMAKRLQSWLPAFLRGGKRIKLPRHRDVISTMLYINHSRNLRTSMSQGMIDVYIQPRMDNSIQLLDYNKEEQCKELGYRATKASLTEWLLLHPEHPCAVDDLNQSKNNNNTFSSLPLSRAFTTSSDAVDRNTDTKLTRTSPARAPLARAASTTHLTCA